MSVLSKYPLTTESLRKDLELYYVKHLETALSAINDPDIRTRIELLIEEWCDAFESDTEDNLATVLDFLELYYQKINETPDTTECVVAANNTIEIS